MSFGKLNTQIQILTSQPTKDADGFVTNSDTQVAEVRAYFEQKNSTEKWLNMAQNSEVNALFRMRAIPNLTITNKHYILCGGIKYNIYSIENIRNRGMYLEILGVSDDG
ncbi:MAG: head-tail adaptor protein [Eubacteriales bacterium]|nr:head-tail adaptor protein [Eubacteriales bacterium]